MVMVFQVDLMVVLVVFVHVVDVLRIITETKECVSDFIGLLRKTKQRMEEQLLGILLKQQLCLTERE